MGMLSDEDVERQSAVLRGFGLPTQYGQEVDIAAVTEAMRSGTDVPAARTRTPMTTGSMRQLQPSIVPRVTITEQRPPIQQMHDRNVTMYHCSNRFRSQFGTVIVKTAENGSAAK